MKIISFIISKSSAKQCDFTPIDSTALFPKINFILGNFSTLNIVLNRFEKKDLFIYTKIGHEVHKLKVNDLLWIKSSDKYVVIHTKHRFYLKRDNIESFIGSNNLSMFVRIHRSYAVNIKKIDSVKGRKVLIGNQEIPISKTYYKTLQKSFHFQNLFK